jgi:hypothetical protein
LVCNLDLKFEEDFTVPLGLVAQHDRLFTTIRAEASVETIEGEAFSYTVIEGIISGCLLCEKRESL